MLTATLLTVLAQAPDAGALDAGAVPYLVLPEYRRLEKKLEPSLKVPWIKKWAQQITKLQSVKTTTWWCTRDRQQCLSEKPAPDAGVYDERKADDEYVWGRIADPLGYVRAFEVLNEHKFDPTGKKILDFGYGNVSQLYMLANTGVEVHGVEVDSLIPLTTKPFVGKLGAKGSLTLHHGYFPSNADLVKEIGGGYALWMSKNTMKRGYVHPAEPPGAKAQIDLGDDAKLLELIKSELAPGGFFFIYNISAAQTVPYKPMADPLCPFTKEQLVAAGFEVIAHDVDDSAKMLTYAKTLEWNADWPDVDTTLNARYTLVRKPK
ncbi:MAG: hypothetical protein JNM17_20580 [Archangium sp.]|nr:hypothetical protein [Archangium sp.]